MAGPAAQTRSAAVTSSRSLPKAERAENFPVALRLLPATLRADLHAVYAVLRAIDDTGDDPRRAPADRLAALDALETDLRRVWAGAAPAQPALAGLRRVVDRHALPLGPFVALVEGNRLDQVLTACSTYDDLRAYCRLSAEPVGRIVLRLFDALTPENVARSDDVCAALQVLEHCQDVGEDRRAGRVYLPQEDLTRFHVPAADLEAPAASPALRRLLAFEVDRAAAALDGGAHLVGALRAWARLAVAGYVAGGLATVDALRRVDHDVLSATPRPRRRDLLRHLAHLLVARPR